MRRVSKAPLLLAACLLLPGCASQEPAFLLAGKTQSQDSFFSAGVASCEFTPARGVPLAGYGGGERRVRFPLYWGLGWPGRLALRWHRWTHEDGPAADFLAESGGAHDPLLAKALVLAPDGGTPFAIVRIDALESSARLHRRVCELVRDLGFRPETVTLSATHTHSGPGGFLDQPLAELFAMDVFQKATEERIAQACARAVREALASARPASIGFARAKDEGADGRPRIARNRRSEHQALGEDDLDRDVELVLIRDRAGKEPIATLANYAVHGTVLGAKNLYFSSDFVAPAEAAIARCAGGGEALFVNSAEGDVAPRAGSGGLASCRAEGEEFAAVCSGAFAQVRCSPRARFRGALGSRDFGDAYQFFTPGNREAFFRGDEGAGKWITAPLTLPANALLWILGFTNVRLAVTWNLSVGAVLDLSSYGDSARFQAGGLRIEAGDEDVFLFAAPCEAIHTVGLELKKRGRERGASRVLVLGLSQDAMSYVASREEYFRGGYEATMTFFGPDTEDKLYSLEAGLLDAVGYGPVPRDR